MYLLQLTNNNLDDMDYQSFLSGLNQIITTYNIQITDGWLTDNDGNRYGVYIRSIRAAISSLMDYFHKTSSEYVCVNDMLSDLLKMSDGSNAGYIKQLINIYSRRYRYHYRVTVQTAGSISFATNGNGIIGFNFNNVEYPVGLNEELYLAVPQISAGIYDLYIYSIYDNEGFVFETTNCSISFVEFEHCISYYINVGTNGGALSFTTKYNSVKDVNGDASLTIEFSNNNGTIECSREGSYNVLLYCQNINEEIIVKTSKDITLGSRSVRW